MSWLFSRALVEEYSRATSSAGDVSAPLSVMPTAHRFWFRDRTMEPSQLSRFGLKCNLLTEDRGEALLTWYREDFLARTSASPEREPASTESEADCGTTWRASWAKYDPNTCSWRTAQHSLLGDSEECSVTWPRSGTTQGGRCWELAMSVPPIEGTGSGSWPTPTSTLGTNGGRVTPRKTREGGNLIEAISARMFPTPTAGDAKSSGSRNTEASNAHARISLTDYVRSDGGTGRMVPTPAARDWRHPNAKTYQERGGGTKGEQLPNFVGGSLNPTWVEWLMGWPIGWTALEPLAMARCPCARQPPGEC